MTTVINDDAVDVTADEKQAAIRDVLCELLDEGQIEMVGRTVDGDAVFATTEAQAFIRRVWRELKFIPVFPAWVLEMAAGYTAISLAALFEEPPWIAERLADIANWLNGFRSSVRDRGPYGIWLSIRPCDCPDR